ncbi:DUF1796 domain-containing protein [Cohnella lubricantis]|uniref:Peptidase n=1 Tax=Cohnella lubricantis TaxID=2163172 RepID=A0A841T9G6_9BACL|nr:DUF1796 family putative cysteine peptidase [Cohnella lubricantis]MBB6676068.1 hypothetical protein [Cohnella lubricantis]MBP2118023.1 hypothetical protein [Cohnella lubricantis]
MRWHDCADAYRAFISLGSTCQTAYQLRRLGLRAFAGPLDWFMSREAVSVARLIRSRFHGFMDPHRLELIGVDPPHHIVRDTGYNIDSYHDFPMHDHVMNAYPAFKQRIYRRICAMQAAAAAGPVCYVRIEASRSEAVQLHSALRAAQPGAFRLLVVNFMDDYQVRHEDWGLTNIASVSIPRGPDWRGSDSAWDQIMRGFRVTG